MTESEYLTRLDVQARYSVARSTLYDWISKSQFPRPVKFGPRLVRWRRADLEQWEKDCQAAA